MSSEAGGRGRWRRARRIGAFAGVGLLGAIGFVYLRSESMLNARYEIAGAELELPTFSGEALSDRGRHLVTSVVQCAFCHGEDLSGKVLADDPWIGRLYAPNLTPGEGGIAARYSQADWVRALRFGVAPSGRSLLLMPSAYCSSMSDRDLVAVIDYLRRVPPIDATIPPPRAGWGTRFALTVGAADDLLSAPAARAAMLVRNDSSPASASAPEPAATPEYGRYLVDLGNCRVCHHEDLRGGLHALALPGEPEPPDLRPGGALEGWTSADFGRALTRGLTPDGRTLDREYMPWPLFADLSPLEVDAIWLYLRGIARDDGGSSPRLAQRD